MSGLSAEFRAATLGTRLNEQPSTQVFQLLQFCFWRKLKGPLGENARLAQTCDESV
jgi:hypothetical protein